MCLRTTKEGKLVHFRIKPDKLQICNYTGFRACLLTIHSGILWLCLLVLVVEHLEICCRMESLPNLHSMLDRLQPRRERDPRHLADQERAEWLKVHKKKGGKTRTLIKYLQHVLKLSSRLVFIVLRFLVSVCSQFVVFQ